ncbi:Hypothetical protein, putative [Bodo saltans]|uniref:Uncharacterized protein n=1 Tax=Bodo saltans TaxID=75058 RepID=A0A0S4IXQ7_BODSA|nr:Hypothetical protein, putative [Bodo saltans]|eukprot:CUG42985.1 Hypothetical protein, putative [Bodo saltans]
MLNPVAMFNTLQGIALWQLPTQSTLSEVPSRALIVADFSNNVIRCVSGPGVSSPFRPPYFEATAGTVRGAGSSYDAYIHPVTGALFTSSGPTVVVRYDLDNRTGAFIEPLLSLRDPLPAMRTARAHWLFLVRLVALLEMAATSST